MWSRQRARRWRRTGTVLLLLGVGAGVGVGTTTTWHFAIAADFFAACAVSCFVLCVPFLLGPVGNTPRIGVDCGSKEIAEAFRMHDPGACHSEWISEGLGGEVEAVEIGGDFAGGGFDCDFEF